MSSFSNRPGYGEPLPLSSDYQAMPSARGQYGYNPQAGVPSHRHVPSAPHSLSPVAMASARSSVSTGRHETMDPGPSRPSAKAGMSILFAGAIIGGLIGAVMHARQTAADAYATATQQHEVEKIIAPPAGSGSSGTSIALNNEKKDEKKDVFLTLSEKDKADKLAADKLAADKKNEDKAEKLAADKKIKGGGVKKWPVAGGGVKAKETVASAAEEAEKVEPKKKGAAKDDDDGYTVASADGKTPTTKTEKTVEKVEKVAKTEKKTDKADKAEKTEKAPAKKNDDAVNMLKAAMGATENTLN